MSHKNKYKKYKSKCINLLNRIGGSTDSMNIFDNYKFIVNPDNEYIKNYKDDMFESFLNCFMPNITGANQETNEFKNFKEEIYKMFDELNFVVECDDKIIGFADLTESKYKIIDESYNINTHKIMSIPKDDIKKSKNSKPCLELVTLCKNKNYERVGEFIIKSAMKYIKSNQELYNKYKYLYIVPGSSVYKDTFKMTTHNKYCEILDHEKYKQSNVKLTNYYEKLGFKIVKNNYFFLYCTKDEFLFFPVLRKKL